MQQEPSSERLSWLVVAALSVIGAGAAIGNENTGYFWDLTSYVEALDSPYPYRAQRTFPFLYPPLAADLMRLARSHLFELASIAYVGAIAVFLTALARLRIPRRFEWCFAITSMGGLGIVSVQSGNIAIAMNFTLLAMLVHGAMGQSASRALLPVAVAAGSLIKPQFIVFLALVPLLEPLRSAIVKVAVAGASVAGVYLAYMWWRPFDWTEYVTAVTRRAVTEKDYAWGPAGFIKNFNDSDAAALAAYVVGLLVVGGLSWLAWQRFKPSPEPTRRLSAVSLAFVLLTFLNPRLPLYDVYAAAIALGLCCAAAQRSRMAWALAMALAINLVPWSITEFTRAPDAYPWWMWHLQITHFLGLGVIFIALATGRLPANKVES